MMNGATPGETALSERPSAGRQAIHHSEFRILRRSLNVAAILVAEDDLHILRVVSLWLERNGHKPFGARTGQEALERLRAGGFDLLVADVNMPGMTGVELLAAARSEGVLPRGVIMLTSRCDQNEIAEAVRRYGGVVHPKPFSPSRLLGSIEEKLSSLARAEPVLVKASGGSAEQDVLE